MVTDIQGVDYTLCDPEVASSELKDPDDNSFRFCTAILFVHLIFFGLIIVHSTKSIHSYLRINIDGQASKYENQVTATLSSK